MPDELSKTLTSPQPITDLGEGGGGGGGGGAMGGYNISSHTKIKSIYKKIYPKRKGPTAKEEATAVVEVF